MPPALLALDIGNSRINYGAFQDGALTRQDYLPSSPEYAEKICATLDEWRNELGAGAVIIASVVPRLGDLMSTLIEEHLGLSPIAVENFKQDLLPLRVDRPETVGVDRVVNCYAAIHLYGAPAIVISMGTATTFEAISREGEYIGGAIAPGVRISLEALTQRTALLPPAVWRKPARIIGKNTLSQMEAGIFYGSLSQIEGMARRLRDELGDDARVIGTGGISTLLKDEGVFDAQEPVLTLKGLNEIYQRRFRV
ncbi:MAG: type III pantothenate kinase [bacterium]|nr:type III pantothenate kinase [bacterium]